MSRQSFGFWGIDLDSEGFARALAALGILQGHPTSRVYPADLARLREGSETFGAFVARVEAEVRRAVLSQGGSAGSTVGWTLRETPSSLREALPYVGEIPRALAVAWGAILGTDRPTPLRLEVQLAPAPYGGDRWQDQASPDWIVEQLSLPAVRARSVYVALGQRPFGRFRVEWNWPLTVGFLDDPNSRRLRAEFERARSERVSRELGLSLQDLVEPVELRAERPSCDLLVLPFGLRQALARLILTPARASLVLMLDGLGEPWGRAESLLAALQTQAEAMGLAFAPVGEANRVRWLIGLIASLARDVGLDLAAYLARENVEDEVSHPPLLFADPGLLDNARMSTIAGVPARRAEALDVLVRRAQALEGRVRQAQAAALAMDMVLRGQGVPSLSIYLPLVLRDLYRARALAEALRTADYPVETRRATEAAVVRHELDVRPVLQLLESELIPELRWIQARVFDYRDPTAPQHLTRAFRTGAPHAVEVRIGPAEDEWTTPTAPFPDSELPEGDEPHRLTIVFTDLHLGIEPQVNEVLLPPVGPSSTCRFFLHTSRTGERVEASIAVLHGNRVLQTALLRGPVVDAPLEAADDSRVQLDLEVVARTRLADVGTRRRFDAALIVNHTEDGRARITTAVDDRVEVSAATDLQTRVEFLHSRLEQVIEKPDDFFKLDSEGMRELLVALARNGSLLYADLDRQRAGGLASPATKLIQVVTARPDAHYPLEFVYDRRSPFKDATVCPNAARALADGQCPESCPSGAAQHGVVCPLGFWCMTKVIERVPFTDQHDRPQRDGFLFRCETTALRRELDTPLAGAVFAASDIAGKRKIQTVVNTLTRTLSPNVVRAETWRQWEDGVAAHQPALLVLLPHTLQDDHLMPTMEISKEGGGERLSVDHLAADHVRASEWQRPIVLLLGCRTADPTMPLASFVTRFAEFGAAVVLATLTNVLGDHAAPVARRIASALVEQSTQDGETFGDVMLKLRRQFLAKGLPMVLALAYYGDADWVLGRRD